MDGVFTQCPSHHPETGARCVRLKGTHREHRDRLAKDHRCRCWTDEESVPE